MLEQVGRVQSCTEGVKGLRVNESHSRSKKKKKKKGGGAVLFHQSLTLWQYKQERTIVESQDWHSEETLDASGPTACAAEQETELPACAVNGC